MDYFCDICGESGEPNEFSHSTEMGGLVCVVCAKEISPNPQSETEDFVEHFSEGLAESLFMPEYAFFGNPGNVKGVNAFEIKKFEAKEALALNEYLKNLLNVMYEGVPPGSTNDVMRGAAIQIINGVSNRIFQHFRPDDPAKGNVAPLIVVDGAVEEGGNEASTYLRILHLIHDKYVGAKRKYLESIRGGAEPERRAAEVADRGLWNIGSLIRRGEMGERKPIEEIRKRGIYYKRK